MDQESNLKGSWWYETGYFIIRSFNAAEFRGSWVVDVGVQRIMKHGVNSFLNLCICKLAD